MEVLDVKKEAKFILNKLGEGYTLKWILRKRNEKDLSNSEMEIIYKKMYDNFFERYKFVEFYWLTMEGWERAIELSRKTNISVNDMVHLATALEANCDFLVTNDRFFCKQASEFLPSCSSNDYKKNFKAFTLPL